MQKGERFSHLPEAMRNQLEENVKQTTLKSEAEKARADEILKELLALDFWPTRRVRPPTKEEEKGEEMEMLQARNLHSRVEIMDGSVKELERQIRDLAELIASKARQGTANAAGTVIKADVDMDGMVVSGSVAAESSATTALTREDHARLSHRLTSLEDQFKDLDNRAVQMEDDISDRIDAHIDALREELKAEGDDRGKAFEELRKAQQKMDGDLEQVIMYASEVFDNNAAAKKETKQELERITQEHAMVG